MTALSKLTPVQRRILRDAAEHDGVIVNGKQRRAVNRLCILGLVTYKTVHLSSVSVHGRDEITVTATGAGRRSL